MTDHWFYKDFPPHGHFLTSWRAISAEENGQRRRADWTRCLVSSIMTMYY